MEFASKGFDSLAKRRFKIVSQIYHVSSHKKTNCLHCYSTKGQTKEKRRVVTDTETGMVFFWNVFCLIYYTWAWAIVDTFSAHFAASFGLI